MTGAVLDQHFRRATAAIVIRDMIPILQLDLIALGLIGFAI